jgi:hypothetical protein
MDGWMGDGWINGSYHLPKKRCAKERRNSFAMVCDIQIHALALFVTPPKAKFFLSANKIYAW